MPTSTLTIPTPATLAAFPGAPAPADAGRVPPAPPPASYSRVVLHRDDEGELVAARWAVGGESSLHGHGDSAALYRVVSGSVVEERFTPDGDGFRCETLTLHAGDTTYLPPGCYHRVRAVEEAVTLHGYSPAPDDAVAGVPAETLARLDEARARAGRPRLALHVPTLHLPDVVREHVDVWAEREAE